MERFPTQLLYYTLLPSLSCVTLCSHVVLDVPVSFSFRPLNRSKDPSVGVATYVSSVGENGNDGRAFAKRNDQGWNGDIHSDDNCMPKWFRSGWIDKINRFLLEFYVSATNTLPWVSIHCDLRKNSRSRFFLNACSQSGCCTIIGETIRYESESEYQPNI